MVPEYTNYLKIFIDMEVKIVVIIHGVTNGEQAKGSLQGCYKDLHRCLG